MKIDNYIKMIAGLFVFVSALLGYLHNRHWLLLTMFVGFNLFQYSITGFCPMGILLKKIGIKE